MVAWLATKLEDLEDIACHNRKQEMLLASTKILQMFSLMLPMPNYYIRLSREKGKRVPSDSNYNFVF